MHDANMVGDRPDADRIQRNSAIYIDATIRLTALFLHSVGADQRQATAAAQLMAEALADIGRLVQSED